MPHKQFSDKCSEKCGNFLPLRSVIQVLLSFFRHLSHEVCHARHCQAVTMWGHEKMNTLSLLSVFLLGIVTIWLIWPMVADPINRRRSMRATAKNDTRGDDLFHSLAKHAGPEHDLFGSGRG